MASWAGPAPPPPRADRSRSPSRGAYGRAAYPDTPAAYAPDQYRGDWDAYHRDRAWAEYEREKAAYDYGRRGRSRSPPYDEGTNCGLMSDKYVLLNGHPQVESGEDQCHRMNATAMTLGQDIRMTMVCIPLRHYGRMQILRVSRYTLARI